MSAARQLSSTDALSPRVTGFLPRVIGNGLNRRGLPIYRKSNASKAARIVIAQGSNCVTYTESHVLRMCYACATFVVALFLLLSQSFVVGHTHTSDRCLHSCRYQYSAEVNMPSSTSLTRTHKRATRASPCHVQPTLIPM